MTKVLFQDKDGKAVADAVVVITSAPEELPDLGFVTDEVGAISLMVSTAGNYGFMLTDALGGQLTAHTQLLPEGEASVTALALKHPPSGLR